jgi:hypothetical protein
MELPRVKMGRRSNKRFNYTPRYFDEEKEDLENRIEKIKAEVTGNYSKEGFEKRLRAGFKNREKEVSDPGAQQALLVSRLRVLLLVVVFSMIAYMVFYTNTIEVIFQGFRQIK